MAGTNRAKLMRPEGPAPVVVLVQPQLAENIGAAARAMLNCGLTEMRLVAPRDGPPNSHAYVMASRADAVLDAARIHDTTKDAIADLQLVFAATARPRDMLKTVMTPRHAAAAMRTAIGQGQRVGILFGRERTGLESDDVVLADHIITVPLNPGFASLNLAQAVLLVGYEWFIAGDSTPPVQLDTAHTGPATKAELIGLFEHLEAELDASGFFANIQEKRAAIVRSIRNIFQRGPLLEQDIRTLRGIIKALAAGRPLRRRRRRGQIGESTEPTKGQG